MSNSREISQLASFITVDDATKNIGITSGTTPYVGVGSTSPKAKLDVLGDVKISGVATATSFNGNIYSNIGSVTTLSGNNAYYNSGIVTTLSGTNINYSGIATLGSVLIKSGIISATSPSGIVTYYGDGRNLTGVNAFNVINQTLSSSAVYPTFANSVGVTSIGISTTQVVFIPSTGNFGIGINNPQTKLEINGVLGFTGGNVKIGSQYTGSSITFGFNNNFLGDSAGFCNTSGYDNNFFGYSAGYNNTTGTDNNFFGFSGYSNTTGSHNNFLGFNAGRYNTTGNNNNFFGQNSGYSNTTGSENVFLGTSSGSGILDGSYNIFIGSGSGSYSNSDGNENIYIGRDVQTSGGGSQNIVIGPGRSLPSDGNNQLVIGAGSTNWIYGNSSYNIGIGTTNPTSKLSVYGDGYFFNGTITNFDIGGYSSLQPSASSIAVLNFRRTNGGSPALITSTNQSLVISGNESGTIIDINSYIIGAVRPNDTRFRIEGTQGDVQILNTTNTSSPTTGALQVSGGVGIASDLYVGQKSYLIGNVGIGTTNPTSKLTVSGDVSFSGVSTISGIKISAGIITASGIGTVVYYGDGSHLIGVNAFNVIQQNISSSPVYPTLASNTGVSSVGISSTGLIFIPVSNSLGIGTTNPSASLHVVGNARITGGIYDSTNAIGNSGYVLTSNGSSIVWQSAGGVGIVTSAGGIDKQLQYNRSGIFSGTNQVYYDYNTGYLGISTSTPRYNLEVVGTVGVTSLTVSGNAGIGTTSPSYKLDVVGDINSSTAIKVKGVNILDEALRLSIAFG